MKSLRSRYVPDVKAPREPLSTRLVVIIRRQAEARGETQTTLGQKSGLGQWKISRLYSGRSPLKVDELEPLCVALDLSVRDVVIEALD